MFFYKPSTAFTLPAPHQELEIFLSRIEQRPVNLSHLSREERLKVFYLSYGFYKTNPIFWTKVTRYLMFRKFQAAGMHIYALELEVKKKELNFLLREGSEFYFDSFCLTLWEWSNHAPGYGVQWTSDYVVENYIKLDDNNSPWSTFLVSIIMTFGDKLLETARIDPQRVFEGPSVFPSAIEDQSQPNKAALKSEAVQIFFAALPFEKNPYWTEERRKHATLENVLYVANLTKLAGFLPLPAVFSDSTTVKTLLKVFEIPLEFFQNNDLPKIEKCILRKVQILNLIEDKPSGNLDKVRAE